MMQFIRSNAGKYIVFPTIVLFLGWMVFEIGMEVTGATGGARSVGSVNGEEIPILAFQERLEALTEQERQMRGGTLTAEDQRRVEDQAFESMVQEALVRQELERRGIGVTSQEIVQAAKNIPHPQLSQQEIFQTNGQFDLQKYQQFLASPQAPDDVLRSLEAYFRSVLPQAKLERQITAGVTVTDAELWRAYQDEHETATVEYVSLEPSQLVPGDVPVSDAEVAARFRRDRDKLERPRTARLTVAYLSTTPSETDRAAALQRARRVREEIAGGADFATVARRESADSVSAAAGGDLGTVTKGQTVPEFDAAAFSLPLNELSQPVLTQFGYHLLQVSERTGDEARVRHILIPIAKSEEELARLDVRADSLVELARQMGIERAARVTGATLRRGVTVSESDPQIQGVGPALEVLNWAAGEAADGEGPANPVSDDVFEAPGAVYIAQLESYQARGRMSQEEAAPQIRRDLILEKKRAKAREVGEAIVREVRGGKTLQAAAQQRGLTVETAGPFTRGEPNQALGQANAAIGAAFGTPVGQVSSVVETTTGLFIIRPTQRTTADRKEFEAQKAGQRATTEMRRAQAMLQRYMNDLRNSAEVKDNRDRVFGRS